MGCVLDVWCVCDVIGGCGLYVSVKCVGYVLDVQCVRCDRWMWAICFCKGAWGVY